MVPVLWLNSSKLALVVGIWNLWLLMSSAVSFSGSALPAPSAPMVPGAMAEGVTPVAFFCEIVINKISNLSPVSGRQLHLEEHVKTNAASDFF